MSRKLAAVMGSKYILKLEATALFACEATSAAAKLWRVASLSALFNACNGVGQHVCCLWLTCPRTGFGILTCLSKIARHVMKLKWPLLRGLLLARRDEEEGGSYGMSCARENIGSKKMAMFGA